MVSKIRLVLEGVPYEIERKGDLILVDGQEFPWSVKGDTVTVGGNPHTVQVQGNSASVDGIAYSIEAQGLAEQHPGKARKAAAAADLDEPGVITAVMPGLVIKINKKVGDKVEAGEVVMILEAMKMQNELHARQSGVVKQIHVKQGESVEMRQVLAVIE
jgi:pyruvate carboxylase subunit B